MKTIFNAIIVALALFTSVAHAEHVYVSIDRIIRQVAGPSSCNLDQWENKLNNACKCYLVTSSKDLTTGRTAYDIIQASLKKNLCSMKIINEFLAQQLGAGHSLEKLTPQAEDTLKSLIRYLADKAIIIKEVEPANITFDGYGNFNEKSLKKFLVQAYKDGKITNPAFKNINCFNVKDVIEDKGYNTLQLFLIDSKCEGKKQEFILKEMAEGEEETLKLMRAFNIKELEQFVLPNIVDGYPRIALPLAYIAYETHGKKHFLSLMPKAPGVQLSRLMEQYKQKSALPDSQEKKKNLQELGAIIAKAYYAVGEKMGRFQKKFMQQTPDATFGRTVTHGDMHKFNVFFDPVDNNITLIDNERMAENFADRQPAMNDFLYLIYFSLDPALTSESFFTKVDMQDWFNLVIKSFVDGYLGNYAALYQKQAALKEIKQTFTTSTLYGSNKWYQKYKAQIDAVFKDLYSSYQIN